MRSIESKSDAKTQVIEPSSMLLFKVTLNEYSSAWPTSEGPVAPVTPPAEAWGSWAKGPTWEPSPQPPSPSQRLMRTAGPGVRRAGKSLRRSGS